MDGTTKYREKEKHMNEEWHGFGMGFGGWIIPLLIIVFIIYFLSDRVNSSKPSSAQDILDKRYANGGLSKEEYEEKSKHIKEHAEL